MNRHLPVALSLSLALCGCHVAPVDPALPRVDFDSLAPKGQERELSVREGDRQLGYLAFDHGHPRAVLLLGGAVPHAGWFGALAARLDERGFDTVCLDPRGTGINRENRGFDSGFVRTYEDWLADVDSLLDVMRARYDQVYLGGHSFGGRLALAYALGRPDRVTGTLLIAPTLRWADGSWSGYRLGGYVVRATDPKIAYDVRVQPAELTRDTGLREKIERDPLRLREVTNGAYSANVAMQAFLDGQLPRHGLPVLLVLGADDRVIGNDAIQSWLAAGLREGLLTAVLPERGHALALEAPGDIARLFAEWADTR